MRIQRHSQDGSILAIMLIMTTLIGLMLAAYLTLVGSQNKFTQRSQVWNNAIPVCEAGVEEALAHINYNGTSDFGMNGWRLANGFYVKNRTNEDVRYEMSISTEVQPTITVNGYVRAPVQANYIGRSVRVKTKINRRFPQAVLAKGGIAIGGSGKIDSFDSTNSAYSTAGQYDPAKAHDAATVATLSKTAGALNVGNASVYGKVATGPGGTVTVGNGSVGSQPWVDDAADKGKIQPGYVTDDMNVYIPDAKMPDGFVYGMSPLLNPLGTIIGGVTYKYVLTDGDWQVDAINMSSSEKILISGKARLYVKGNINMSGQSLIQIASGASLEMYLAGTAAIGGGGVMNIPGQAKNFSLYGLPTSTAISYAGNSAFIGTIYAPQATVSLVGTSDAMGAFVAKDMSLSGGMGIHYDEALRGNPKEGRYLVASWQEI
jgi:Putative Ice-binding-like adhesive domain